MKTNWSETGYIYGVHEVYYDEKGKVTGMSETQIQLAEETRAEMLDTLEKIKDDISKHEVLEYDDIPTD